MEKNFLIRKIPKSGFLLSLICFLLVMGNFVGSADGEERETPIVYTIRILGPHGQPLKNTTLEFKHIKTLKNFIIFSDGQGFVYLLDPPTGGYIVSILGFNRQYAKIDSLMAVKKINLLSQGR